MKIHIRSMLRLNLIGLLLFYTVSSVSAQSVMSISGEVLKDVAADEVYWQVSVTCLDVDEPRLMQQRAGESQWCSVDLPQLCGANKSTIAEELCSEEYDLFIASDNAGSSETETRSPPQIVAPVVTPAQVARAVQPARVEAVEPAVGVATRAQTSQPVRIDSSPIVSESQSISSLGNSNSDVIASGKAAELFNNGATLTAEELAIEEELLNIEEELLELRLKEIELESQK